MRQKSQLNLFIDKTEAIVRRYYAEADILQKIRPLMDELILSRDSVPQEAFKPRKDRWAINLIYMPEDKVFSIISGVWLPYQSTLIHDHMTWAVIGMYSGEENETLFRKKDKNTPLNLCKIEKVEERVRKKGDTITLTKNTIHSISNLSEKPSLTVQVYGLDIGNTKRHTYDPVTGEIKAFVKSYDSVLNPNFRNID